HGAVVAQEQRPDAPACQRQRQQQARTLAHRLRRAVALELVALDANPDVPHRANISSPRKRAASPRISSIRRSWLYFAMRSVREADPVLICPAFVATARSAMVVSSVSPERCEITAV